MAGCFIEGVPPALAKLIEEAHLTPSGGHGGFLKTLKRLTGNFYWPNMKADVKTFVQQCHSCQQTALFPAGLLQVYNSYQHLKLAEQLGQGQCFETFTGQSQNNPRPNEELCEPAPQ
ncbi:unnamed protein product [Cuscuta campestris]|uniref:Integrase zinc-binding domain-containing protein n=1 Tax=Cuscuta campestris TaxID=132261 RepID=A0A484LYF0_9ASTE|nr:unnamed protein product [Cuscuta campestris]